MCGAFAALAATSPAIAAEPTGSTGSNDNLSIDGLLAAFRRAPGIEAHFVETRQIALLALPLESNGVIYFAPPGVLARHQTSPSASFQIIEPTRVRFGNDSHTETIQLGDKPVVKAFVDSFVTLISGDKDTLYRLYTVAFKAADPAQGGAWQLTLQPRVAPVSKIIARITLTGTGLVLSTMQLVETGGDETMTTFSNVNVARTFIFDERTKLFRLSGKQP